MDCSSKKIFTGSRFLVGLHEGQRVLVLSKSVNGVSTLKGLSASGGEFLYEDFKNSFLLKEDLRGHKKLSVWTYESHASRILRWEQSSIFVTDFSSTSVSTKSMGVFFSPDRRTVFESRPKAVEGSKETEVVVLCFQGFQDDSKPADVSNFESVLGVEDIKNENVPEKLFGAVILNYKEIISIDREGKQLYITLVNGKPCFTDPGNSLNDYTLIANIKMSHQLQLVF